MNRNKVRRTLIFISLLLFPITLNYFSPYVSIDGAFNGIISASVSIFTVWFLILISGFVFAGGIKGIDPFHLTENGISVDMPLKYITYYMVLGILFILTLTVGKRGACHSICWMSPFISAGAWLGDKLNLPQLKILSKPEKCIHCAQCDKVCPMSISVMKDLEQGWIKTQDCIQCAQCVDVCPKSVLSLKVSQQKTIKS